MHKLLKRQLKRHAPQLLEDPEKAQLLSAISDAYEQHEQTSKMLERSLFLTSNELNERNQSLKQQVVSLEEVQKQLEQSVGLLSATFDATGEMILVYDVKGQLENFNSEGRRFFEAEFNEIRTEWSAFLSLLKDPSYLQAMVEDLRRDPKKYLTGMLEAINGQIFEYRSQPLLEEGRLVGRVWCLYDVTVQIQHERQIKYQAFHDALTGLPNRNLLLDRIKHALERKRRTKGKLAVLFLDLDDFKKVNDTEGHDAGDELLKLVAQRITDCLREQDTLSRLGGDEFVVVLEGTEGEEDVTVTCDRLVKALRNPFEVRQRTHFIGTSVGIAMFPNDGDNPETLIRKADMAMYQAKKSGKNDFKFYRQSFEMEMRDRVSLENKLRDALEREALTLFFQPKVDLNSMQISGAEALIRWPQPDGSYISPAKFIDVAEQSGLILEIGRFVVTRCCQQLAEWKQAGLTHLSLAFNLSSIEFQDPFIIEHIRQSIDNNDIAADKLIIELTESIFLEDKEMAKKTMISLKQMGVSFALDDFGQGYSSFNYLQSLPIQYLKIDKAFLQEVATSRQSAAITQTIIDIGRNLGLTLIAEGIEDAHMLTYLQERNVAFGQGFYLHKPMSADALAQLLSADSASVEEPQS